MELDNAAILAAVAERLVEHERRGAAALDNFGRLIDALADRFADELDRRFAELPVPSDGEPGKDGLDRVLALPRHVKAGEAFERNEIAWHAGGLWQAVRAGVGGPDDDPAAWRCLVPGVAAIEAVEDWTRREFVFAFRMSDGHRHETRARMLPGYLPPGWHEAGVGVIAGDLVRDGEFERTALVDGADPGDPTQWLCREIRGRRGRDGKSLPGDPGPPGPGLVGLTLARAGERLAIVPRFADPGVEVVPIAVDLLVEDPAPGLRAIVGFAGKHAAGRDYGRGVVVSGAGGLWLSLKPDNRAPLVEGASWERML